MINIIKNLNFGGMIALVAMMMLTVSWTVTDKVVAAEWFAVSDEGSALSDKKISGPYPGGTPGEECQLEDGEMCAVPIDRKNYTGPITDLAHANALEAADLIEVGAPFFRGQ